MRFSKRIASQSKQIKRKKLTVFLSNNLKTYNKIVSRVKRTMNNPLLLEIQRFAVGKNAFHREEPPEGKMICEQYLAFD